MSKDPTLEEVRAVLQRIQQIDTAPANPAFEIERLQAVPVPPREALRIFDEKYAATVPSLPPVAVKTRRPGWLIYVLSAVAAFAVAGLGAIVISPLVLEKRMVSLPTTPNPRSPDAGAPPQSPVAAKNQNETASDTVITGQARNLLSSGDVTAARDAILKNPAAQTPGGAFALAQSYDPNYLATLPNPNGASDRAEAERWYRRWYDLALASGLKMDPDRLSRIIKAMN